ncbi:MAG TPA: lycopene cyclase family protein [Flavisolibacter sp.]|nr:lycopene cyclase family protein [Flavisolibacter sp.]
MQQRYDYIITGTGCAGLSLAMHMIASGNFADKKILLVDAAQKATNDRTWCFWEKEPGLFEPIVHKQWEHLWFYGEEFYKEMPILPYRYKMIRGVDFYHYCFETIKQQPNIQLLQANVERVFSEGETGVVAGGETFYADYVFNSILFEKPTLDKNQYWLLQHFKGWTITTPESTFDHHVATLMDFRISQEHGTAFCYVLPVNDKEALIEYTLFTKDLLPDSAYDAGLKSYIENIIHLSAYEVKETEFGIIPMTNYKFERRKNNIVNIGTAGGQTKGSSGYTFYFIQQHSKALVDSLAKTGKPFVANPSWRFPFYDSVLLNILHHDTLPGKQIFSTLFQKNKATDVLTFLNNESSLAQELKIISSLPTLPFLKAAINQQL